MTDEPKTSIIVYGGGAWGATLALHLGRRGESLRLWDADPAQRARLGARDGKLKPLPGVVLPETVEVVYEEEPPRADGGVAVLAVPSHALRQLVGQVRTDRASTWVIATKGLELDSCLTMSQVAREVLGPGGGAIVILAGPSLALEVAERKPSAVLAASDDPAAAERVQHLFATDRFRVYTNPDPIGVELGTALKNVVALAAGIADGLELGQNARGALLTRGLAEIRRLGEALGARPETFLGLAGIGDLVTTCTSPLSRNHTLGEALARGEPLEEALARIGMVVEGVRTSRAACELADRTGVEMPIARQVARILFEGVRPADALRDLMTRPLRAE